MPSLKDLKNRIASVKATQKITKAMKMVAAAKLRRAQEAAEAARPYSQRMSAVLANIAQATGGQSDAPKLMSGTGGDHTHLLVVCTAERGLCGGFNSQIARFARDHTRKLLAERQSGAATAAIYDYEPDAGAILDDLIPRNISVQIFRALLENVAGEMGAKMSAMDNATRNAGEMINKLTLNYNRQRQAQITKELIEIISGAEAL